MEENRAASNAIGVILMVAVVVVLGVTVAAYANNAVSESKQPAQSAAFEARQSSGVNDAEASSTVSFILETGDNLKKSNLEVRLNGEPASSTTVNVNYPGSTISSGDRITVTQQVADSLVAGDKLSLVLMDGDSTKVLKKLTTNDGGVLAGKSATFIFTRYSTGSPPGSPWSYSFNGDEDVETKIEVSDAQAAVGDRSLLLQSGYSYSKKYSNERSTPQVSVDVNLSGVETVKFQVKGESEDVVVSVGGDQKISHGDLGNSGSWTTISIDVSTMSGVQNLLFSVRESASADDQAVVYFDDIRFYDSSGNPVSEGEVFEGT